MKMNYKKIAFIAVIMATISACLDESKLPLDFDGINSSNGVFLRQISVPSGSFDPFDLDNSSFVIELEVGGSDAGLLKEVRFIADFTDNTTTVDTLETDEALVKTVDASQFAIDATSGLLRSTVTITANEALAALGITQGDVFALDQFSFNQVVELTDDRTYSVANTSADILGGAFYGSPFVNFVPLVCAVDDALYLGDYDITISGSSEFGVPIFNDQTITLEAGEQPYQRVFGAAYLEDFGFTDFSAGYIIQLICGQAFLVNTSTGLGCGGGAIVLGSGATGGTYNELTDDSFTVTFIEANGGLDGGCGMSGANEVTMTLTKAADPGPATINDHINILADFGSETHWPDATSEATLCDLADIDFYVMDLGLNNDFSSGGATGNCPEDFTVDLSPANGAGNGSYVILADLFAVTNLGEFDVAEFPISMTFSRDSTNGESSGVTFDVFQANMIFDTDSPEGAGFVEVGYIDYTDGVYTVMDQDSNLAGTLRISKSQLKEKLAELRKRKETQARRNELKRCQ